MTHEAPFPDGVLEYILHVIQSKFTVQSNFKIPLTHYLSGSDTVEGMDSQNPVSKYSSHPSSRQLSTLPLEQENRKVIFPKVRGLGKTETMKGLSKECEHSQINNPCFKPIKKQVAKCSKRCISAPTTPPQLHSGSPNSFLFFRPLHLLLLWPHCNLR